MTPEEQQQMDDLKAKVQALEKEKAELEKTNQALEADKAAAEKTAHEAEVDAQLSAAGFNRSENGQGFQGVSVATYGALLSATAADAQAMIADLKPTTPRAPAALLSDTHVPDGDAKLSGLVADAAARGQKNGANYV